MSWNPLTARLAKTALSSALLAVGAVGCASAGHPADSAASEGARERVAMAPERPADLIAAAPSEAIVAVHRAKCGACHTRVEPGSVNRATLESALQRHRRRAKLTERQWEELVDYLSADGLAHARSTAQNP